MNNQTISGKHNTYGFTLIELLISIAIVSILAGIAYPSYVNQILKSRRGDGQLALLNVSQQLERCKTTSFTYVGCNVITTSSESPEKFYSLSIANVTTTDYELSATPQNEQSDDTDCGTLTLDETGTRNANGTMGKHCW